jgi:hypothetical protein
VTAVLIEGRGAKITYVRAGAWTEQHYQSLLKQDAGSCTGLDVTSKMSKRQRTWRRPDGLVPK